MDWSEDLGGLKLRMRRESESPQDIVLEFDVHDKALLTKKPLLKIRVTTQRLKYKWQGIVFKGGNWDTTTIFRAALPIDTPGQTFVLKNQPFYDFKGEEIESFCIAELSHTDATGEQRVPNALPYPISELNDAASAVSGLIGLDVKLGRLGRGVVLGTRREKRWCRSSLGFCLSLHAWRHIQSKKKRTLEVHVRRKIKGVET